MVSFSPISIVTTQLQKTDFQLVSTVILAHLIPSLHCNKMCFKIQISSWHLLYWNVSMYIAQLLGLKMSTSLQMSLAQLQPFFSFLNITPHTIFWSLGSNHTDLWFLIFNYA